MINFKQDLNFRDYTHYNKQRRAEAEAHDERDMWKSMKKLYLDDYVQIYPTFCQIVFLHEENKNHKFVGKPT